MVTKVSWTTSSASSGFMIRIEVNFLNITRICNSCSGGQSSRDGARAELRERISAACIGDNPNLKSSSVLDTLQPSRLESSSREPHGWTYSGVWLELDFKLEGKN